MRIERLLPELDARNAGKATERRRPRIPTRGGGGKKVWSDHLVAGVRWLYACGWMAVWLEELLGSGYAGAIVQGLARPHVEPAQPDSAFWREVAAVRNKK